MAEGIDNQLSNTHELTAKDLHRAYGFLFCQILSHLALLWGNSSGDWTLLDTFKENLQNANELSAASKEVAQVTLNAAQLSVKATLDECKAGGVSGLN